MDNKALQLEYSHNVIECTLQYLIEQRQLMDATKLSLHSNVRLVDFEKEAKALQDVWTSYNMIQPLSIDVTTIESAKQIKACELQLKAMRHNSRGRQDRSRMSSMFQEHLRLQREISRLTEKNYVSWQSLVMQSMRTDVESISMLFNHKSDSIVYYHLCITMKRRKELTAVWANIHKHTGARSTSVKHLHKLEIGDNVTVDITRLITAIHVLLNTTLLT
jgi:hypothetical protein